MEDSAEWFGLEALQASKKADRRTGRPSVHNAEVRYFADRDQVLNASVPAGLFSYGAGAAAGFLWWCGFSPKGLRTSGFTVDSSTGVVPLTTVESSAPAGTRKFSTVCASVVFVTTEIREASMPWSVTRYSLVLTARCAASSSTLARL